MLVAHLIIGMILHAKILLAFFYLSVTTKDINFTFMGHQLKSVLISKTSVNYKCITDIDTCMFVHPFSKCFWSVHKTLIFLDTKITSVLVYILILIQGTVCKEILTSKKFDEFDKSVQFIKFLLIKRLYE